MLLVISFWVLCVLGTHGWVAFVFWLVGVWLTCDCVGFLTVDGLTDVLVAVWFVV